MKCVFFISFSGNHFYILASYNYKANMQKDFKQIFYLAKKQDRLAQKNIYDIYSGKMLSIVKSYIQNQSDAEDILIKAFLKCFNKINDCKDYKSFEFWLRKIIVNDAISFIRKNKNILYLETEFSENDFQIEDEFNNWEDNHQVLDLEKVFSEMPLGYKLVFNLSVFEDKKHREIAEILNISEGTSKSQLSKAKKWLVEFFNKKENERFIKK
jgi:RNA polymerase sigma factor (sigma-70 family)